MPTATRQPESTHATPSGAGAVVALARCANAGQDAGLLLMLTGLAFGDGLWQQALPRTGDSTWLLVRSAGLYALLGAGAGLVLGGILWLTLRLALTRHPRRADRLAPALTLGLAVAAVAAMQLTAWWQLDVLDGLPWSDPGRQRALIVHGVIALGIGASTTWLHLRWRGERPVRRAPATAAMSIALATFALAAGSWGLRLRPAVDEAWQPSQIAVIGLDGLTFRVMAPLLARGELPTFARLIDEGAAGTLLTYGAAASPIVWTSVATGKRARDHGILDFVTTRGDGYRAVPYGSGDWRAQPVWSLLGEQGRRVAVVNWLMTEPPRPVQGTLVGQIENVERVRTHPPALAGGVEERLAARPLAGDDLSTDAFRTRLDRVFDTAEWLLEVEQPRFLAVYASAPDAAQHRTWRFYEPRAFDDAWHDDTSEADAAALAETIPQVYRHADRRLGRLLERLDPEALVIVLSDHGQLAEDRPRVRLRLDELLVRLGSAVRAADGTIDPSRSEAYNLVQTPWAPQMRINVNLLGRERRGIVPSERYRERVRALETDLAAIRFADGTPLFADVRAAPRPVARDGADGQGADLLLDHSRATRHGRGRDRLVRIGDATVPFAELIEVDTSISGDHDRRAVLFVHGRGIRRGPIGNRAVDTAAQVLLRHLTDRVDAVDALLRPLAALGLVERATTLDITPTVLYAAGLPVGRDMAGRPLVELFEDRPPVAWVDTWETGEGPERTPADRAEDEALLERLRALGYVD